MSHIRQHTNTLEQVAMSLIAADSTCQDDSLNLPSVDGIVSVVQDVRELLFPGYRNMRRPVAADRLSAYTNLLRRIEAQLRLEIGRAISHRSHSSLKLHVGGDSGNTDLRSPATLASQFLNALPAMKQMLDADVAAAFDGDPAAKTSDEIVPCYPGIEAIMVHRIARQLYVQKIPYLPRILSEWAHRETGIDIHPGAAIGPRFFIDHGTGVVIGETCVIGAGVTLYQGVTLGAWSFPRDEDGNLIRDKKRHPTLEDNVTVYSNATILGGSTVIGQGSLVGSSVTLSRSIPPNTIVTIDKPSLRFREAG